MKKYILAAGVAAFALAPVQASAVTGNIPFNGTVTHTCVITVGPAGALAADASFQTLVFKHWLRFCRYCNNRCNR